MRPTQTRRRTLRIYKAISFASVASLCWFFVPVLWYEFGFKPDFVHVAAVIAMPFVAGFIINELLVATLRD